MRDLSSHLEQHGWERIPVSESDTRFPSLQQGFNRRWVGKNMESYYLVSTPRGAAAALDNAVRLYGPRVVRIKSGAHCYENFVFDDTTKAVIDVKSLLDYGNDRDRGYFLSSGDSIWGAFNKLFTQWGKILPASACYSVGLGGHISGGGDGIMSRLHGLIVDWLTGVEVVVKRSPDTPANVIYVSPESRTQEERDLFWAHTGGGGGNFGIITKYYFKQLPDAPQGFIATSLYFDWADIQSEDDLARILDWNFEFAEKAPWNTVGKLPIFHSAAEQFIMYIYSSYCNQDEKQTMKKLHYDLEKEINGVLKIREPKRPLGAHGAWMPFPIRPRVIHNTLSEFMEDNANEYPCYSLLQTMSGSGPNQRGKFKSAYMKQKLPRQQIKTMFDFLSTTPPNFDRKDLTETVLQFDIFGGMVRTVDKEKTAIAQRGYNVKLQYQTYWQHIRDDEKHLQWMNSFYDTMYTEYGNVPNPLSLDPVHNEPLFEGCYYNYPDDGLNGRKAKDPGPDAGKLGALSLSTSWTTSRA